MLDAELINEIVADDTFPFDPRRTAAEVKLIVTRNIKHLELQATKDWYIASSNNKTPYTNAVTAGKAYVAA